MININLFERKQINRLPLVIIISFLILFVSLCVYLFGLQQYYVLQDNMNMQQIENQADEVREARKLDTLHTQIVQSEKVIQNIESQRHSIPYLFNDLHTYLPDNDEHITSFNFTEEFEVLLSLYDMNYEELTQLIEDLNAVEYITLAQLVTLTKNPDSDDLYISDISIRLDELMLREVDSNEI